jgi:hypothetical protein
LDGLAADGMPLVMVSGATERLPGDKGARYLVDTKKIRGTAETADHRPYVRIDHPALRDWKWSEHTPDGEILVKGDMMVHPDHARHLANILENPRQSKSPVVRGLYKVAAPVLATQMFLKQSKLALGTFHLATEAEHAIFHTVNPITRGFALNMRDANQAALVRSGLDLGATESWQLFSEGLGSYGGLMSRIPGLGDLSVKFTNYLFQDYIPKLKMKMALHALERNLNRYGEFGKGDWDSKIFTKDKLTERQIHELTAMQSNAALNYRLMGRNPMLIDFMRLTLLAPDFLEARMRFVGQAFTRYGGEQRRALMLMAATVYVGSRILNWILDDDPHWEPRNALYVIWNGHKISMRTVVQDAGHLVADPKNFIAGRLSPLTRIATEATTSRDWRGIKRDSIEQMSDAALWLVPIGFEGLVPGSTAREQTPLEVAGSAVGIVNKRYTHRTEMREMAADFNKQDGPAAQKYQHDMEAGVMAESKYRKLDTYLEADKLDDAAKEYDRLISEGIEPEKINARFKSMVRRPFTGTLEREERFKASLTEPQKAAYNKAIEERRALYEQFIRLPGAVQEKPPKPRLW